MLLTRVPGVPCVPLAFNPFSVDLRASLFLAHLLYGPPRYTLWLASSHLLCAVKTLKGLQVKLLNLVIAINPKRFFHNFAQKGHHPVRGCLFVPKCKIYPLENI